MFCYVKGNQKPTQRKPTLRPPPSQASPYLPHSLRARRPRHPTRRSHPNPSAFLRVPRPDQLLSRARLDLGPVARDLDFAVLVKRVGDVPGPANWRADLGQSRHDTAWGGFAAYLANGRRPTLTHSTRKDRPQPVEDWRELWAVPVLGGDDVAVLRGRPRTRSATSTHSEKAQ